jgi:hypothetical protein
LIDRREILDLATQSSLTPHVIEKDYVLGWMLAGIYAHDELTETWLFKGGTCLKKCFFETYRFSEDLDFTLRNETHLDEAFLKRVFAEVGAWVYQESGIEVPADQQGFEIYRNPRGNLACQGKISYRGPVSPTRPLPRIKLDLTADERVVLQLQFVTVLREKCTFKGIALPQLADLLPHRSDVDAGWSHMLDHQLPALLPVDSFWNELPGIFNWLHGQAPPPVLPAMPRLGASEEIIRERVIGLPAGSRGQSYIEVIRFAAANRLLVNIDYRDQQGNRSTRAIEAYSLRRSRAGDVLLMAVRADSGQPRSYRLDSILGVSQTQNTFTPRYPIELTPSGPQSIPATTTRSPAVTTWRTTTRRARSSGDGPTYVFRCTVCRKLFERKTYDGTLRTHKNPAGYQCYGTYGTYVRTKY